MKQMKGITLIALVVTVVVLIIIAGISVATLTGENGIINKSEEAKRETEISQYQEQLDIIKHQEYGKYRVIDVVDFLYKYAEAVKKDEMFKDEKTTVTVVPEDEMVVVITKEGYIFEVTMDDVIYVGNNNDDTDIDINDVKVTISKEPSSWTNGKVNVKITSNARKLTKQYSLDNGKTWQDYSNPIEVENNGTEIQARAINKDNETSKVVTGKIENIDRLKPEIGTPIATGIENGIKVEAKAQDQEATQIDGESGIKGYQFSNDNGTSWTETKTSGTYTFNNLSSGTTYQIKVKAIDNAGNEVISQTVTGIPIITVPDAEGKIIFTQTPNNWTNDKITVTMQGPSGYTIEYSVNGESYQNYTTAGVVMEQNGIITARLKKGNETGKATDCIVDKIDKLAPYNFDPSVTNITTNEMTVVGSTEDRMADDENGCSGIRGYQFSKDNGANWTEEQEEANYTFTGLEANQTYQIKIKVFDNAGNSTESGLREATTSTIPSGNENITIKKNPGSGWTKGPVKVTIETSVEGYTLQYSYDNRNWNTYEGELTITDNEKYVYARLFDGNTGGTAKQEQITNIDKLAPYGFTPEVKNTTTTVTVIANATDQDKTATSGKSGIRGYRYSKDNGATWTAETTKNTWTFTGLSQGETYQVKVIAIDNAGNETESEMVSGSTVEIPGAMGNIKVERSENGWTNKPVIVTLSTEILGYNIEYSINNANSWETYSTPISIEDNNTVIYARLTDGKGGEGSYITEKISNIDRLAPKSVNVQIQKTTSNSISVIATAEDATATGIDGKSGIVGYKFYIEGQGIVREQVSGEYTFDRLQSNRQYQIRVTAVDGAGNEKDSEIIYENTNSMPNPSNTIKFTKTPNDSVWTNQSVDVTISTTAGTEYILQYSRDNRNWYTYINNAINVSNNYEKIYARLYDPNSQEATTSVETQITNIDKLPPKIFTPQVSAKTNQITVTASNVTDQESNTTSGKSGIRGYKFYIEGRSWTAEQQSNVYTFSSLTPGRTYEIRAIAIDKAGNEMESYATTGTTQVDVDENDIIISQNPATGWTNQSVYVTITKSSNASQYTLEYSLNNYNWYPYTTRIEMKSNGTVYARLVDSDRYSVATNSRAITNIDKTNPTGGYSTNPPYGTTASEVTINLSLYDEDSGINYSSVRCTSGNVTMITSTQYTVTANGFYNFTFQDNAGNSGSVNVEVINVEEKKLRVGDYVEYTPNASSSFTIPEEWFGWKYTVYPEDLEWRVFDIKDDGTVELISNPTSFAPQRKYPKGYNNVVYGLNNIANNLYSNPSIGATARNIKIEDVIDKINPGYDYVKNIEGHFERNQTATKYGYTAIPSAWKLEKGNNSIDGVPNNGTLGQSEQNGLVTNDFVYANSNMVITNQYFNLKEDTRYNMKTVETKESDNDSEIYADLLLSGNNFIYATRTNLISYNLDLSFATQHGPWIMATGRYSNDTSNYDMLTRPMRLIVTLPKSSININTGNGELGNGWGIQ